MFELSLLNPLGVGSQSKHSTTMNSVLQLIVTSITFETVSFLRDLVMMATVSPDYMALLNRIMVYVPLGFWTFSLTSLLGDR